MKPRITIITIGVDDLERSLRFYRDGLGLSTDGIVGAEFEYGAVVFIEPVRFAARSGAQGIARPGLSLEAKAQPSLLWDTTSIPRQKSMRS
jgi:catechol 2,3-dioxygenase-like lactoylglutathione lyase family enzyme